MTDNKYPLKAFVFISQTDGSPGAEYYKYRFQEIPTMTPDSNKNFEWRFSLSQQALMVFMHKRCKEWLGGNAWEYLGYGGQGTHKLADAITANPRAKPTEDMAKQIFGEGGTISQKLAEFYNDILIRLDAVDRGHMPSQANLMPCTIFMHWGGGEEADYRKREKFIQKFLPKHKNIGWKFFSIGSQRNELFYVDGSTIVIPDRLALEELERKLDFEGKKEEARKIMTEYVLAAHNSGDESNSIKTEGDVFGDAVQEVVGKMGKEWGGGYLEEDEQSRRVDLIAHYEQRKTLNERGVLDSELTKLFKIILEEEA